MTSKKPIYSVILSSDCILYRIFPSWKLDMPSKRTSRMPATDRLPPASPVSRWARIWSTTMDITTLVLQIMKSRCRIASNWTLYVKQQLKKPPSERNLLSSDPQNPSKSCEDPCLPDRDLVQLLRGSGVALPHRGRVYRGRGWGLAEGKGNGGMSFPTSLLLRMTNIPSNIPMV